MSNFRSKAFNPASKRVEDAEYCDNYYGQHRYGIRFDDGCVHPEAQCRIDAVATQLDSLLKEREALQARVKELEKENEALQDDSQSSVIVTNWFDLGRELNVPEGGSVFDTVIDLRERATRLQQERDEAIAALNAILSANDDFRAGLPQDWEGDQMQDACDAARDLVRRLAGHEKEKKE